MPLPSIRTSRRVALLTSALAGFGMNRSGTAAQRPAGYPVQELLTLLPKLRDDLSVRLYRVTLAPGASMNGRYQGMASIMVESGTLTLPLTLEKTMKMMAVGPTLPSINEEGTPAPSWSSGPVKPPHFQEHIGVIAEDGDFGEVRNEADEDLVLLVMESYAH